MLKSTQGHIQIGVLRNIQFLEEMRKATTTTTKMVVFRSMQ